MPDGFDKVQQKVKSAAHKKRRPDAELTPLQLRRRAMTRVQAAIKRGKLPKLDGTIACTDCGAPAVAYEHRNYYHALAVDPVCTSCNVRRGPGFPINPEGRDRSFLMAKLGTRGHRHSQLEAEKREESPGNRAEKSVADFIDEHWVTWETDPDLKKCTQEQVLAKNVGSKRGYFSYGRSFERALHEWFGVCPT